MISLLWHSYVFRLYILNMSKMGVSISSIMIILLIWVYQTKKYNYVCIVIQKLFLGISGWHMFSYFCYKCEPSKRFTANISSYFEQTYLMNQFKGLSCHNISSTYHTSLPKLFHNWVKRVNGLIPRELNLGFQQINEWMRSHTRQPHTS